MPYISELLNNQINDSSDASAGKLVDILIKPENGTFSPLEFLVIKTAKGEIKYVPYEAVANFTSSRISLKNLFNSVAKDQLPPEQFIYLKRDVLDQQIVDVAGTRIVRVDDLRIGNFENRMCVLAIDSSFPGLLRRLGLSGDIWGKFFKVQLIDWRQAQLLGDKGALRLNTAAGQLGKLHPADLANIVEEMDIKHGSTLLASLDAKRAAKVLEEVDTNWQNILVKHLGPEKASKILAHMSVDEVVDLVKTFSSQEEARAFLSQVGGGRARHIERLTSYPDNTAGGLMTTEFVAVRPEWTVAQVREEIKKLSPSLRSIGFVYVTADDGKFLGLASMRRLLVADAAADMKSLAKSFGPNLTLRPRDKMRKIIKLMTKYNLYSSVVLDEQKRLLGVVTIDDVMRQLFPSA
ncbi:MAG: CBS domain-containing protein [Patescibacteria group bacterium]|nr:CBS domain-containing protein [Patescibacteria group bacterium]